MESKKAQILEHIQSYPGKTFSEIIKDLQISASTVRFHLIALERSELIINSKIDKTRYFTPDEDNQIKIAIENNSRLTEILEVVDSPKTLDDIFCKTKVSKSVISKRLKILIKLGFIERKKVNSKIFFQKHSF